VIYNSYSQENKTQEFYFGNVKILPKNINSPYSESAPVLYDDSHFFFITMRNENFSDYQEIFNDFWTRKIYSSKFSGKRYSTPVPLPKELNSEKYFTANFSFNHDRTEVYISRYSLKAKDEFHCELWHSKFKNNKWEKLKKLPDHINLPGYQTTQPCLVEYDDFDVLYFASDRPNGYGHLDLWFSILKNEKFEEPINLGSIVNSTGNEITPFYDQENNRLFFSSDGHEGMGGYDVFYSIGGLNSWVTPQNLGKSLNSKFNDYCFSYSHFNKSAYFVSNRPPSKSNAKDTCCLNIYSCQLLILEKDASKDKIIPKDSTLIEKMEALLPIKLYFHNDIPDPRSTDTLTLQNYESTLKEYLALKPDYMKAYAKGLKGVELIKAQQDMDLFFTENVETGFEKLEQIVSYLTLALKEGKSVKIKIKGSSSPLFDSDYNKNLSLRRIKSIENYLLQYKNGVLKPYLQRKKSNSLQIIAIPLGSEEATKKNISRNAKDKRNSIYSVEASEERNVEFVEVIMVD
jgi:outer membrane protein OmpA-like peptidoglycan-associated protein